MGNISWYIYNNEISSVTTSPELNHQNLIIPPLYVSKYLWTKGYFVNKSFIPLTKEEQERQHFMKYPSYRGEVIDDNGYFIDVNNDRVPAIEDEYNNIILPDKIKGVKIFLCLGHQLLLIG